MSACAQDQSWSYDQIAEIYATDMGSNLPFDDVAFYRDQCAGARRILELGCGTGRVLLPLLEQGLPVIGIDRSEPMLAELRQAARARGLSAQVMQGDATCLPFDRMFDRIVAPFSMVVYMTSDSALSDFFRSAGDALVLGGVLLVDAFLPADVAEWHDFRQDYRRLSGDGWLERHRRIQPLADGVNRIERRYVLEAADGTSRAWTTTDHIRPYGEDMLTAFAERAGLAPAGRWYDYGRAEAGDQAQFATYAYRRPADAAGQAEG